MLRCFEGKKKDKWRVAIDALTKRTHRLGGGEGVAKSIFGAKIPSGKANAKAKRQRPVWLGQKRKKEKHRIQY